jgi:argininosuccinate lyase
MQEDKESVFDAVDTVKMCLAVYTPMIRTMRVKKENLYAAAQKGFLNATDLADYLVKKGMPFRTAYKAVGQLVGKCVAEGKTLEEITLEEYKAVSDLFDKDLYEEISLETCVGKRISAGGTGPESVKAQIESIKAFLKA